MLRMATSAGMLHSQTRRVQLCLYRAHHDSCLAIAPNAQQMLTISNVSCGHTLSCLPVCPISVSLCAVSSLGAICQPTMIPMSAHPVTVSPKRLSCSQSSIFRLTKDLGHTRTACCRSGLPTAPRVESGHGAPVQACFV